MSSNIQKAFKTKSKLRGMADGGIMEENVGGVRTFTDRRAAGSGARAYTPSSSAGSMSVVGMAPAQRAAMDASIASNRAGAAQAHEQRMGRAPDPTTALANALNKAGAPPAGSTPAPGTAPAPAPAPAAASPLRAPVQSLPPVTVTPPPAAAPAQSLPPVTVTPPPAAAPVQSLPPIAVTPSPATAAAVPQLPTTTVFSPSAATGAHEAYEYHPDEPTIELADGGKVKGKGGPTDDKVGPVMLSDGEYVLPADTVDIVGRENLDALRLATHDFVDDSNKPKVSSLRKMANGGTFYVDPEGVASRRMPPSRAMAPYQPPGREMVPYQPPARPSVGSQLRNVAGRGLAGLGGVLAASDGVRRMADEGVNPTNVGDTASGAALIAQAAGRGGPVPSAAATGWLAGRAIYDNMSRDAQDAVGGTVNTIVRGTGQAINRGLRAVGADTEFGSDWGVDDDAYLQSKHSGGAPQPRRQNTARTSPQIRTSEAGPAVGVDPGSYQSRRLAEMGVPVDQQNLAPVTDDTRRSLLREGGGTPGQYVNLGSYGGDANIYGTASEPGGRINSFTGVGASSRPDGGPQEDPIMSEIRSVLRGLNDGAGNRGGSSFSGRDSGTNAINRRYDDMLRRGRGRNPVRGSDWSQRHGLRVEAARARELNDYAQNRSTLRGQDMTAETAANSSNMQARMQALQTLGTMANQRDQQIASTQAAQLRALQDAARDERDTGDNRAVRAVSQLDNFLTQQYGEESPEGAEFARAFRATNPEFMTMPDGDRASLLAQFKEQWDAQRAIRERAAALERPVGIGLAEVDGTPSEVRVGDWWNNRATFGDWMESFNLFGENDRTAVRIPAGDGINMLVSERDLITRPDGSKRAEVISRLRNREGER